MDAIERKRMILRRQFLTAPGEKLEVCGGLCGVQAQYTKNAYHALKIRVKQPLLQENWGEDLYKAWTLRGTVHVYPQRDQAIMMHENHAEGSWSERMYFSDPRVSMERKKLFENVILERLAQGNATREALKALCQSAGMTESEQEVIFHPWGGVIRTMAERGELAYCVEEKKIFARCESVQPWRKTDAYLELLRRYLTHYGPVTIADIAYFFIWKKAEIRNLLAQIDELQSEMCEGETVYWLGEREIGPIPECIMLAGFDPLILGYEKTQSIFLPCEFIRGVFNLTGIVFPTILYKGTVIGRWKEQKGKVELTAFKTLSEHAQRRIEEKAAQCVDGFKSLRWIQS